MKSRKLILIALASCIFPSGCDRFHRRPENVPSSAVWIDGAFIDCTVAEHSNANRCTVFKDKTGEVLAEGLFVLDSSLGAATKADLRYAGFRDKTILLEDARTFPQLAQDILSIVGSPQLISQFPTCRIARLKRLRIESHSTFGITVRVECRTTRMDWPET